LATLESRVWYEVTWHNNSNMWEGKVDILTEYLRFCAFYLKNRCLLHLWHQDKRYNLLIEQKYENTVNTAKDAERKTKRATIPYRYHV